MSGDISKLSAAVKDDLRALHRLLTRLSGGTLRKIPAASSELPAFGRMVAIALATLGMFQRFLFRRILEGEAVLGAVEPPWAKEITYTWVDLPERQQASRISERRLRELLEKLNTGVGLLDEETLQRLPAQSDEIPEFLALTLAIEENLAWYLQASWFLRMFPERRRRR